MSIAFCHQNILFMAGFGDYTLIMLTKKTADRLIYLADKYETKNFLTKDGEAVREALTFIIFKTF